MTDHWHVAVGPMQAGARFGFLPEPDPVMYRTEQVATEAAKAVVAELVATYNGTPVRAEGAPDWEVTWVDAEGTARGRVVQVSEPCALSHEEAALPVVVEVWPVSWDRRDLLLLSGVGAWRSRPVPAGSEPHAELVRLLAGYGVAEPAVGGPGAVPPVFLHSTSWRPTAAAVVLTYLAVIPPNGEHPFGRWPDMVPIRPELSHVVPQPRPGPATEPPDPRTLDVLYHGLRHLRYLLDTDPVARTALAPLADRLAPLEPALAGLYDPERGGGSWA